MDVRIDLQETSFKLDRALLVYTKDGGYGGERLASVHEIAHVPDEEGRVRPVIGTGRPLTGKELGRMIERLGKRKQRAELLPQRVLASSPKTLVWFRRIGNETIYFDSKSDRLNALSGKSLPHPGLVFKVSQNGNGGKSLSVWAKRERGRPSGETILYHAPFFNVYKSGSVCHGSMREPAGINPQSIEAWEKAFFQSAFTHGSGVAFLKSEPGYEDTLVNLYEQVKAGEEPRFPTARLKRTGSRLADLLK